MPPSRVARRRACSNLNILRRKSIAAGMALDAVLPFVEDDVFYVLAATRSRASR